MPFPDGFAWGVATSAYQIEGAAAEDGRASSVWDSYARRPGKIFHGHTGDVACDHYHRYREDIGLMRDLGVRAYRFSVAWPRVLPDGIGAVNRRGLDFYERVVDELLRSGITPWITLFHWDYPQALHDRGGWLHGDSPDWFAEYTAAVVDALSDRVEHFTTLNEPQVFVELGHRKGWHAPGQSLPARDVMQVAHHALVAHGRSVQVIRSRSKRPAKIGIVSAPSVSIPATDSVADLAAARTKFLAVDDLAWGNTWWLDPIVFGRYPEAGLAALGMDAPRIGAGDMDVVRSPIDFCALNIYFGRTFRAGRDGDPEQVALPPGYDRTALDDWPITPECLYWGPRMYHERYRLPIVITENGHQNLDGVSLDGKVHDPQRIDYTHRYLAELARAVDEGVPVDGYFHWTLTDSFEWGYGYKMRCGLVYTDFVTQRRIPKDSFAWYRRVIETNGASLRAHAR